MEQKVILLACAAGMSTSLLVTKMQEVSKKDKIFAIPVSKVDQKVNEESIDVICYFNWSSNSLYGKKN